MSTIDGLSGNSAVSAYQYSGTNAVAGQSQNDKQGPGAAGASKFADAISAALSQVTGSSATSSTTAASSTSSTSGTSDSSQAEATFAQNLFAALQAQAGGAPASGSSSATTSSGAAPAGGHHHHHGGGGGGKISSGLDSLASQLTASSSDGSNTSTTDGSDSSGSDPLSALQASFNNLLAANGQSGSSASLPQFLQTLSQNLQNAPATGNVVSTKV